MHHTDVIVLGPAGGAAALPITACRAGARGVLDLEYASHDTALAALRKVARHAGAPFGVKVGPESARLLDQPPEHLRFVILAGGDHADLPGLIERLKQRQLEILFEAVSLAEARRGVELGAGALVLKGQEAGGRVGAEPSFILLQRWLAEASSPTPIYVQGGVGTNTAAACVLAGAKGVVVEAQALLLRESPLPQELRQRVAAFDGSETALVGERLGAPYRVHSRPGLAAVAELAAEEERIAASRLDAAEKREAWRQTVCKLALQGPEKGLWLLGQDVALAPSLAARAGTAAGLVDLLVEQVQQNLAAASQCRPLAEDALLAKRHRTRYPILQGPMTRVSDVAPFAAEVAKGGGLPFLALALLRQAETDALLKETAERLGDQSWGVGLLGFMPKEIRDEQLAAIRKVKPPFALIAGGRPDQAKELEAEGIPTYLHVPSPGLLRMFLKDGARKFIFEGRECGGHVGPRTSFVLWEAMIEVLLEHLGKAKKTDDLAVVFAGGIHDARSAAMVAALSAPLAERGVAVGVLMGTAYLFTKEAVEAGAIVERFQQEALGCTDTALLQTAPGHAIRCVPTPYCDDFERERQRLLASGRSHEEVAKTLEMMNIGRLRLASKGLDRDGGKVVTKSQGEQYARGMYMIGQVASMRESVVTIAELHDDVSRGGTELLGALETITPVVNEEPARPPCDVAIVGMASFYPGAKNTTEFWHNILDKVNAVTEVPASHWDWRLYYDADPRARDKIISKWGGFLKDVVFNPLDYGITPNSLNSIEPLQLFLLEASRLALTDAGYDWKDEGQRRTYEPGVVKRSFNRDRTAAILGIGGGGSPLAVMYGFRTCLPLLETVPGLDMNAQEVLDKSRGVLPEWTEDSFPGILFNVAVGRVANRFNLGGPNYAIDAACGSSLAAVYACVRELELGTSDLAIAMGADTVQTPYAYMAFSKTHALSPNGRCRPFDAAADGIVLSEGVGAVILKRLDDAVRDGDRIYAVIKGMGASSDGRDKGLTAPRAEGQLRALRRAYGQAGVSPATVELIEAHGTGTVAGDQTESKALAQMMQEAGAEPQSCAVGSVKSMIGHTKCAAGIAGLIKAALSLHHRTLPPTVVETPNGNFTDGPLYLNTEARPWVKGDGPRRAGVSAFGFGGTNFHAVLSEYDGDYLDERPALTRWPAELFVWAADKRDSLSQQIAHIADLLKAGAKPALRTWPPRRGRPRRSARTGRPWPSSPRR
ncbi:MAG: beta-ketoacyl synthase N-terminal-like domain-containing protein [Gemmataceae bacterium]